MVVVLERADGDWRGGGSHVPRAKVKLEGGGEVDTVNVDLGLDIGEHVQKALHLCFAFPVEGSVGQCAGHYRRRGGRCDGGFGGESWRKRRRRNGRRRRENLAEEVLHGALVDGGARRRNAVGGRWLGRGRTELQFELVRFEFTRCWGTGDKRGAPVVATRARWRVGSIDICIGSSMSKKPLCADRDGDGVRGKTGDDGTRTGKVVVVFDGDFD